MAQEGNIATERQEKSVAFDLFSTAHNDLFPDEMKEWKSREPRLVRGLVEGEALRQKILSNDPYGTLYLKRICDAIDEFQQASHAVLKEHKSIDRFSITTDRLKAQLEGRPTLSADSFSAFDGRWFGRWGENEVNHDWQPTRQFPVPKQYPGASLEVHALQYAWISNGFGWNYLVAPQATENGQAAENVQPSFPYILGMVYYFEGDDFATIRGEKAHVGFSDSPTRLVWITEKEVFLEEVFPSGNPAETVYAITALYHDLLAPVPSVSKRATQAVYTRSPDRRPAFYQFSW